MMLGRTGLCSERTNEIVSRIAPSATRNRSGHHRCECRLAWESGKGSQRCPAQPASAPVRNTSRLATSRPAQGQEEVAPGAGLNGQDQAHPGGQQRSQQDPQQQQGRRIHQVGRPQHGSAQQGKHEKIEGWEKRAGPGRPGWRPAHPQPGMTSLRWARLRRARGVRPVRSSGVKSSGRMGSSGKTTSSAGGSSG